MPLMRTLAVALLLVGCSDSCGGKLRKTRAEADVPAELSLGRPYVGDRVEVSFPVTAVADGEVRVVRVTSAHPNLILNGGVAIEDVSIARGASFEVKVAWAPSAPEIVDTTIEVELDLEEAPLRTVHVTGEARALPSCDDGNECTDDVFDRATEQCVRTNHERACDDGSACTFNDQCHNGSCKGEAVDCDDGVACTKDLCDAATGCYHPTDDVLCDDQKPCTTDRCNTSTGQCEHDDATGPSCGPVSCAFAHICVAGTCQQVDISGSTDGLACSDGNACTDDDMCRAGRCEGGTIRTNTTPEIVATLDTFGGEGSFVTTDGHRYVFVDHVRGGVTDPQAYAAGRPLLVTVFDGQQLVPHGSLPYVTQVQPAVVAPGLFAIATNAEVRLVDATDIDAPVEVWRLALPATGPEVWVHELLPMEHGLLLKLSNALEKKLYFLPLGSNPSQPGVWRELWSDLSLDDVDASESTVVFNAIVVGNAAYETLFMTLAADGTIATTGRLRRCGALNCGDSALSIRGDLVALRVEDTVDVFRVTAPATTLGSAVAESGARVVLTETTLYRTSSQGIWAHPQDEIRQAATSPGTLIVPERGFTGIERASGQLMLRGRFASPLQVNGGSTSQLPQHVPLTGVGHGSAITATDGSSRSRVLVGSSSEIGEVDLTTKSFVSWSRLSGPASGADAYFLRGANRDVALKSWVYAQPPSTTCDGPNWSGFDAMGMPHHFQVCGLLGGDTAFTSDRLWSATFFEPPTSMPMSLHSSGLRIWSLNPFNPTPLFEIAASAGTLSQGVRASQDQKQVAWLTHIYANGGETPSGSRIQLLSAASPNRAAREVPLEEGQFIWRAELLETDADAAITVEGDTVRLHPVLPPSSTGPISVPVGSLPSIVLLDASSVGSRIASMTNGEAWVVWEKAPGTAATPHRLSQVHYDAGTQTIEHLGDVALPGDIRGVQRQGSYAVATTDTAVVLVSPACR